MRKRGVQLCKLIEPEFGAAAVAKPISHASMDVCIQVAYSTSASIAKKYGLYTWAFLDAGRLHLVAFDWL
jgi:hypothetical protein